MIGDDAACHAKDHRPMALHERCEGGFIALVDVTMEQGRIRGAFRPRSRQPVAKVRKDGGSHAVVSERGRSLEKTPPARYPHGHLSLLEWQGVADRAKNSKFS